jgi:hypothetical protein
VTQHTGEKPLDPLTLVVSLDQDGSADGWLYEDEGDGFANKYGRYKITTFAAKRINRTIVLNAAQYPMVDRIAESPLPGYIILDLAKGSATRYSPSLNRIEEVRLESGILNTQYRI